MRNKNYALFSLSIDRLNYLIRHKVLFLCGTLLFFSGISYGQSNYRLGITVPEGNDGKKILLSLKANDKRTTIKKDSCIIKNGYAEFFGVIDQPSNIVTIRFKTITGYLSRTLVIDTGKNEFAINLPNKEKENSMLDVSFINSTSNLINYSLDSIYNNYILKYGTTDKQGFRGLSREDFVKMNIEKITFLKLFPREYISFISLYELSGYSVEISYMNLILESFNGLSDNIKFSQQGITFRKNLEGMLNAKKITAVGNPMPIFSVKRSNGVVFTNRELVGKPYLVAFCATWCIPCLEYQPELKRLYNKYHDKGLEVVYFNLDDDNKIWQKQISSRALNWINVSEGVKWEKSLIAKQFNLKSIPAYYIVDRSGKIIYNGIEMLDYSHALLEDFLVKSVLR